LRDRQPELDQHHAVLHQRVLEVVDLAVGAHPVGFAAEAFDAFDQHAAVPGAVEERKAAAPRQAAPEAPQVGLGALFFGGRGHRDVGVLARIQRTGDAADGAALAGAVVAFEHRHHRQPLEARVARRAVEPALPLSSSRS
jgi:hypothetical protein